MARTSIARKTIETETEVAVLQVQYVNLNEKVEGLHTALKDLQNHIDDKVGEISTSISSLASSNTEQHKEVNKRIADLEKWKWTIMGASATVGALGLQFLIKLFGVG